MKAVLKHSNWQGDAKKVLITLVLNSEDMLQCHERGCGQGYHIRDCIFVPNYDPEHHSPVFEANIQCPKGHWLAYCGGKRLTMETQD